MEYKFTVAETDPNHPLNFTDARFPLPKKDIPPPRDPPFSFMVYWDPEDDAPIDFTWTEDGPTTDPTILIDDGLGALETDLAPRVVLSDDEELLKARNQLDEMTHQDTTG